MSLFNLVNEHTRRAEQAADQYLTMIHRAFHNMLEDAMGQTAYLLPDQRATHGPFQNLHTVIDLCAIYLRGLINQIEHRWDHPELYLSDCIGRFI